MNEEPTTSFESVAREVAEIKDPLTRSREGLDDDCFFCGAWPQSIYVNHDFERFAEHRATCLWVRTRQLFGLDIGRHRVE